GSNLKSIFNLIITSYLLVTRGKKTAFLLKMKYDEIWHHPQTTSYRSGITQNQRLRTSPLR
ncbi:MAG: hypothetical protein ACKO2T_18555, partial [Microcystis aeruginosa]